MSNGYVYFNCEDEDECEHEVEWLAPTLENWWNGKQLDF